MNFTIEWHPQAYRVLRKLPQQTIQRILLRLDIVATIYRSKSDEIFYCLAE